MKDQCKASGRPAHNSRHQRSSVGTRCPVCGARVDTDKQGRIRKHRSTR